jgi:UTP--glucose-1-phosphate uridylyltransferase
VDEAREAGIEHFIFITGRNKAVIEDHFDRQFELEMTLKERKRTADLDMLSRDLPGPGSVSFTRQQLPMGLGHAVWCARELVGDEPFALLLPDVLVQHKPGCLAQMIDVYRSAGAFKYIAVEAPMERVHHGVVALAKAAAGAPSPRWRSRLAARHQSDHYGRYILRPGFSHC